MKENKFSYAVIAVIFTASIVFLQRHLNSVDTINRKEQIRSHEIKILQPYKFSDIAVVTRIHGSHSSILPGAKSVITSAESFLDYSANVIICIDNSSSENIEYIEGIYQQLSLSNLKNRITILLISPWGKFVTALNSAIVEVKRLGLKVICFQSLEFTISPKSVHVLLSKLSKSTIVVGPAIQGHEYELGEHSIRGRTCPWNTFALWSMNYIGKIGFLLISDGESDVDYEASGVEEVAAINLLQYLYPGSKAKLINISDIEWKTNFTDAIRSSYHVKKMASKDSRPRNQMLRLQTIPDGLVIHE